MVTFIALFITLNTIAWFYIACLDGSTPTPETAQGTLEGEY